MTSGDFVPEAVRSGLRISKARRYIYVNNPKCATSTIKRTLWLSEAECGGSPPLTGEPHGLDGTPWHNDIGQIESWERCVVFSFVRDPFTRVLSGFLDKIDQWDARITPVYERMLGIRCGRTSFAEFLRKLARVDPLDIDPHFRPQTTNLAVGLLPYDFIGRVESLERDLAYILETVFGPGATGLSREGTSTNAGEKLHDYYDHETSNLVRQLFSSDFENFGYPMEVGSARFGGMKCECDTSVIYALAAAERQSQEGDLAGAIQDIENLVKSHGQHVWLYEHLACKHEQAGDLSAALTARRRAVTCRPGCLELRTRLASALVHSHRLYEAEVVLREGLKRQERWPENLCLLSRVERRTGRSASAVSHARKAVALHPTNASYHLHLGRALGSAGQAKNAEQCYRNAIALPNAPAAAAYELSRLLWETSELKEALRWAEKAVRSAPYNRSFSGHLRMLQLKMQGESPN